MAAPGSVEGHRSGKGRGVLPVVVVISLIQLKFTRSKEVQQ